MQQQYKKSFLGVMILFVIGILVSACGSSGTPAKATGHTNKPKPTITISYNSSPNSSFFYANDHNVWRRFGIKVIPTLYETGVEQLAALAKGSAQLGILGIPPIITAVSKGIPLKIVYDINSGGELNGLYVNPKSNIRSVSDLKGQTVAVPFDSTAYIALVTALKAADVPLSSVTLKNLSPPEAYAAYVRGNIEAVWMWDTWGTKLELAGARQITNETKYGIYGAYNMVATTSFLDHHANLVSDVIQALDYVAPIVRKHPQLVGSAIAQVSGLTPSQSVASIKQGYLPLDSAQLMGSSNPISFVSSNGLFKQLSIANKALYAIGAIPQPLSSSTLKSIIDTRPMENALKAERKNK